LIQSAGSDLPKIFRAGPSSSRAVDAIKDILCASMRKGLYHEYMITRNIYYYNHHQAANLKLMIKRFEGLLARLGLKRAAGRRSFALDASLRTALTNLADQEQRLAEEVQADQAVRLVFRRGKKGVRVWDPVINSFKKE
jgi:hypothetical protein